MESIDDKTYNQQFLSDYEKIVGHTENSVIIITEWTKKGDFFQKLSMYDNSYVPVRSFGNTTTLIQNF